jgi:hypothetical protein
MILIYMIRFLKHSRLTGRGEAFCTHVITYADESLPSIQFTMSFWVTPPALSLSIVRAQFQSKALRDGHRSKPQVAKTTQPIIAA